jgi:hypothetical protein
MRLMLTFGPFAQQLVEDCSPMGGSGSSESLEGAGALADWQEKLEEIQQLDYEKEIAAPAFTYTGQRARYPASICLTAASVGLAHRGIAAARLFTPRNNNPSPDYYKLYLPLWVHNLSPRRFIRRNKQP